MQRVFEEFVQRLFESVDETDLRNALASAAAEFDLRQFAFIAIPTSSSATPRLISNYPTEWTSHYLNNQYERIDPVIAHAQRQEEPFRWGREADSSYKCGQQKRFFDEATEFGIRCGFTVPVPDRKGCFAAMTFAADEPNPPFLRVTEQYGQAFQLIATCFHVHARRKFSSNRTVDGVDLTPREYECLQWAARGKSIWEVGCILGIKRRTAAFHLDNVRRKLGVRTIAQAVARLASSRSFPS